MLVTNMTSKTQSSSSQGKSCASGAVHSSKVSSRRSAILRKSKLTAQDISADHQHIEARYLLKLVEKRKMMRLKAENDEAKSGNDVAKSGNDEAKSGNDEAKGVPG